MDPNLEILLEDRLYSLLEVIQLTIKYSSFTHLKDYKSLEYMILYDDLEYEETKCNKYIKYRRKYMLSKMEDKKYTPKLKEVIDEHLLTRLEIVEENLADECSLCSW